LLFAIQPLWQSIGMAKVHRNINRNYSRRQASGLPFEAILWTRRQVLQIRQFHVLGDLSKPQTWSNTPMK
jgi:hypothetical protein